MTFCVYAGGNYGGTVLPGQIQKLVQPGIWAITIFKIDGIEDCLTTQPFESGTCYICFSGIDHHRNGALSGQSADYLLHVDVAVPSCVIHTDIYDMSPVAYLVAGHGRDGIPVGIYHRFPEFF